MMQSMKRYFGLALFAASILAGSAASACNSANCEGNVLRLYTTAAYTYIELSDKVNQAGVCQLYGTTPLYWRIEKANPVHDTLYANALAAIANGQRLRFRVVPGSVDCDIQYAVLFP